MSDRHHSLDDEEALIIDRSAQYKQTTAQRYRRYTRDTFHNNRLKATTDLFADVCVEILCVAASWQR